MIWLLLAFAVYPPSLAIEGSAGEEVNIDLLIVGDEAVRITTTPPLTGEQEVSLSGSHRLTFTARIHANAPPTNQTGYVYVLPTREDSSVLVAHALPIKVAVHSANAPTRTIPNTHRGGLWAAIGGALTALIGLVKAISVRRG